MTAEILSYARSRGLFAGVDLNGLVMKQDRAASEAVYGKYTEVREILVGNVPRVGESAAFLEQVRVMFSSGGFVSSIRAAEVRTDCVALPPFRRCSCGERQVLPAGTPGAWPIHMILRTLTTAAACTFLFNTGCVSQSKYDDAVRDANTARAQLAKEHARLQEEQQGRASMQKELTDATAVDDQLQDELEELGANARSLRADNGNLKGALQGSQRRLDELRRARAAAEARAALYADLARKLKSMVDAGDLAITLRDGRMVLRLSNDVLFDSGHAELKPAGKRALAEVASVLRTIPERHFQVAGHTDNEPIHLSPFRSNWELSTARALEVMGFLVGQGMDPHELSAAGYGEFDPVSSNDTSLGKTHNRRTEITLQPNIDEIVSLPEP
jgi:chemotaxis protein MotB